MTVKYAGLALMVGVLIAFVAPLFMPGYSFVNSVDQTDFPKAVEALGDSPILAQWMNFLSLIALLLMAFGFLRLYPLASQQPGLGGRLLQFGILATLIEWSIGILSTGMRHFEIHLMQRANIETGQLVADLETAALNVHLEVTAVSLAFLAVAPIASTIFGIGLSKRFAEMNLFKIASYILVVTGLVGLVNFLFALNAPDAGVRSLLLINTIVLYIQGVCLIAIGYGMYKGREGFTGEA